MASKTKPPADFDPADAELTDEEVRNLKPGAKWFSDHGVAPPRKSTDARMGVEGAGRERGGIEP